MQAEWALVMLLVVENSGKIFCVGVEWSAPTTFTPGRFQMGKRNSTATKGTPPTPYPLVVFADFSDIVLDPSQ